jgi:hypothetical protein
MVPARLHSVMGYQFYLQGKTVEEIALQMKVPLATVTEWKTVDDWDSRVVNHEMMLYSTIDQEMKTYVKAAIATAGLTCVNAFVLAAEELQKRLGNPKNLTMKELVGATGAVANLAKLINDLQSPPPRDPTRTKEKNLGTGRSSSPLPTPQFMGDNDGGGGQVEEGGGGGGAGQEGPEDGEQERE